MQHQYSTSEDPIGCGLLGCLGGVIIGFLGGILVLILAAVIVAVLASPPFIGPDRKIAPDVGLIIEEGFLNRYAEQPTGSSIRIDILPGNQALLILDTELVGSDVRTPVRISGQFEIRQAPAGLEVQLIETKVSGVSSPPDLSDFFGQDIPIINQDLAAMVGEISKALGTPIIISGLSTTETNVSLEIEEVR